jgi:hypothetical protein
MDRQHPELAVYRDEMPGLDHRGHLAELVRGSMTGNVDAVVLAVEHARFGAIQPVDNAMNGGLVAGDGARRQDDGVVLFDPHDLVLAGRDQR